MARLHHHLHHKTWPWKPAILLLLVGLLAASFYFRSHPLTITTSTSKVTTPTGLKDFPVYPGATFTGQTASATCKTGQDVVKDVCSSRFYNWETTDPIEKVDAFYTGKNIAKSGWDCTGGTGIQKTDSTTSFGKPCQKGNLIWGIGASVTASSPKTQIHLTAHD